MFALQVAHQGAGLTARLQLLAAAVQAAEGAVRPRSQAEAAARLVDGMVPLLDRQLLQGGSTGRVSQLAQLRSYMRRARSMQTGAMVCSIVQHVTCMLLGPCTNYCALLGG